MSATFLIRLAVVPIEELLPFRMSARPGYPRVSSLRCSSAFGTAPTT
jgi:hypothetical protein